MANENEQDPDALPDFEPESDFSEFEDQKEEGSLGGSLKNNPLVKLGLVAAGLIVIIGGIVLFGGKEEKTLDSSVGTANNLKETPGTKELSPVMQEAMEEYNEQKLNEAVNQGGSVIPVPIDPPKTFMDVPTDAANNEDPLQRWRQMQEERLRVQREQEQMQQQMGQAQQADPQAQQTLDALAQAMQTQMTQLLAEDGEMKFTYMKIYEPVDGPGGDGTGAGAGAAGTGVAGVNGAAIPGQPLDIVIPAGSIVYAQLLIEANSDVEGPIVALVAQGPFSGSRVLGTFTREEELLVMQFTTLVSKEGYSIPINSYGLDPESTLTGMATDVDHRYWRRVVLPAAAQFIEGIGEAIAEQGTTSVTISNGSGTTTATDNSEIDTEQELSKGAEKAFEKVSEILDDEAGQIEPLVVVKAGTPLGILFMEPVTKQDIEQAKFGAAPGGAPQAQAQQQQGQFMNPMFGLIGMNANGQPMLAGQVANNPVMQGLQSQQALQNAGSGSMQSPPQQ